MSATFKNAKKMVKQDQLRKIMKDYKKGLKEVKKIESPLAKYPFLKFVVKSEAVWSVHVNAKQHKQNIELAKKLKEKTNNFSTPLKRPLTPPLPEVPEKKLKGILKNSTSNSTPSVTLTQNTTGSLGILKSIKSVSSNLIIQKDDSHNTKTAEDVDDKSALPEGFFDDPILDAKVRNQEYKDPMEVEWEKFMKEMKVVETESETIIAEDQDEATNERHIEEIDEQMALFNRVLDLEKKKTKTIEVLNSIKNDVPLEEEEVSEEEVKEFLDWRQKKSY
ncbi:hypothetical protein ABEB36_005717 [Hypothenemus hampei]|uniref:ZNF380 coiled-coil domain-containing protein n=1 Tax=Hypothenemus hampei TaxID=57062 RepID=A0ABD1EZ69_HYPHA